MPDSVNFRTIEVESFNLAIREPRNIRQLDANEQIHLRGWRTGRRANARQQSSEEETVRRDNFNLRGLDIFRHRIELPGDLHDRIGSERTDRRIRIVHHRAVASLNGPLAALRSLNDDRSRARDGNDAGVEVIDRDL